VQFTSGLLDKNTGLLLIGNFGDWLAVFKVDNPLVSSSFFVRNLNVVAAAARFLGLETDASKYEGLARAISQAFVKEWWNSTAMRFQTSQGFQSSVALPLFSGICGVLESNITQACAQAISDITIQGECHPTQDHATAPTCLYPMHVTGGIMGAEALLPALSLAGRSDLALAVALQADFPSWAAMTHDGSGALWERWDGDLTDPEGGSRNHVMLSSIRTWAGVAAAGLSTLVPGWSAVLVAPAWNIVYSSSASITNASCSVSSPGGRIYASWATSPAANSSGWTRDRNVRVIASLPPSVSGTICVPCLHCHATNITESSAIVWKGSSGFQPGVAGIRSAKVRQANLLVKWSLAYPGAGSPIDTGEKGSLSVCFDVDSGHYLFESNNFQ
jgi:hypothetical protein